MTKRALKLVTTTIIAVFSTSCTEEPIDGTWTVEYSDDWGEHQYKLVLSSTEGDEVRAMLSHHATPSEEAQQERMRQIRQERDLLESICARTECPLQLLLRAQALDTSNVGESDLDEYAGTGIWNPPLLELDLVALDPGASSGKARIRVHGERQNGELEARLVHDLTDVFAQQGLDTLGLDPTSLRRLTFKR